MFQEYIKNVSVINAHALGRVPHGALECCVSIAHRLISTCLCSVLLGAATNELRLSSVLTS